MAAPSILTVEARQQTTAFHHQLPQRAWGFSPHPSGMVPSTTCLTPLQLELKCNFQSRLEVARPSLSPQISKLQTAQLVVSSISPITPTHRPRAHFSLLTISVEKSTYKWAHSHNCAPSSVGEPDPRFREDSLSTLGLPIRSGLERHRNTAADASNRQLLRPPQPRGLRIDLQCTTTQECGSHFLHAGAAAMRD